MADRNKVIEGLQGLSGSKETMKLIADAVALLKEQPEIVRCKDCKHLFDGEHEFNCCDVLMDKARWITTLNVDPDWYCADGEAKLDD